MRSRRNKRNTFPKLVLIAFLLGSYIFGFIHGQSSAYIKMKDNKTTLNLGSDEE